MMAAPWEDVRDVLVRVGFGSPRPSSSSGEIRVTSDRDTHTRRPGRGDGQRPANDSRRRRSRRTSSTGTSSPIAAVADTGNASTPIGVDNGSVESRRSVGTPVHHRTETTGKNTNSRRNRARGVRPVHLSPSHLLLDLSPAVHDESNTPQQSIGVAIGDCDEKAAAALFSEALSPIAPIPRRTSSAAALSDYSTEGEINGTDVDLSEVHDMVDRIQRNLTEDLKEISTSINNYDDNTNTATKLDNGEGGASGGSIRVAEDELERTAGEPGDENMQILPDKDLDYESPSVDDKPPTKPVSYSPSHTCDDDRPSKTSGTPPGNDEKAELQDPSCCECACDCHKMPSFRNAVEEGKIEIIRTPPKYTYPIPDRESADAPAQALCQTAEAVLRRAEVSGVLTGMVTDIEQTHTLMTDLQHRLRVSQLEKHLESTQRILSERRLVEQSEQERRKELGDSLLVEIMSLGARLVEMENCKIEKDEMATECKSLSRQLASALDQIKKVEAERDDALAAALKDRTLVEIEEMKKRGEGGQNFKFDEDWVSLKEETKPQEEPTEMVEAQIPGAEESSTDGRPQRVKSTDFGVFVVKDQNEDNGDGSGDSEVEDEPLPPLLVLPERALMVLFCFLEAEEILSIAELSMLMYSRVDALFGLGGETSNQDEGGENNRDRDGTQEEHSMPTIVAVPPLPSGPDEGAGRPIERREAAPRIGLAGQAQEGAHLIGTAVGSAVSNLLWQRNLQREQNISESAVSVATRAQNEFSEDNVASSPPSNTGIGKESFDETNTTIHTSPPLLTARVASKMASKLSPQELSVIIQMRTKIKQLEEELIKGREQQDDLMAELRGIEGVKDFLVSKLRDVERSKHVKVDDEDRTAKQIASDQEVIGFLDNKVGELEMKCVKLVTERKELKKELTEIRKYGQVRVGFLEDQIKLLRDEVADSGKRWKAEKRVLVKEIKNSRSNLAVLQAEKRGMQSELTRLKRELSSSVGHSMRSPGK